MFVAAAAMLSLFVCAVSACACSHQESPNAAVGSSCHGPSHDSPAPEPSDVQKNSFVSKCSCFAQSAVPAIFAKKDERRTAVEKQIVEPVELSFAKTTRLDSPGEIEAAFVPQLSNYQYDLLAALPSRAPPRL
jgi:hypothetical protein